jgi:hypothetical protein
MPAIPATQEAVDRKIVVGGQPQAKMGDPTKNIANIKKDHGHGSSDRVPT